MRMVTQFLSLFFIVVAAILLGGEFGWRIGVSTALLGYALMPRAD